MASRAISKNRQLAIRFVAGAWCLACFVLVTAYSSVLIACITAPDKFKPIINSVNDLPNKPEIQVTVNKNLFLDVLFQVLNCVHIINTRELLTIPKYLKYIKGCCERRKFWNPEIFGRIVATSPGESLFVD